MKTFGRIAVAAIAILAAACAAEYQSAGARGGFQDTQLAPDMFRVSFKGNQYNSPDQVEDYALLRAAELTLANRAQYFMVTSQVNQTRKNTTVTPGQVYRDGKYVNYTPPTAYTYYQPGVGMTIRTFKARPKGDHVFDAEFISKSIRAKYQIK